MHNFYRLFSSRNLRSIEFVYESLKWTLVYVYVGSFVTSVSLLLNWIIWNNFHSQRKYNLTTFKVSDCNLSLIYKTAGSTITKIGSKSGLLGDVSFATSFSSIKGIVVWLKILSWVPVSFSTVLTSFFFRCGDCEVILTLLHASFGNVFHDFRQSNW